MTPAILTVAVLLNPLICLGQDSTTVVLSSIEDKQPRPLEVSNSPNAGELSAFLVRGREIDPFAMILKVASKGDNAVLALKELLFSPTSADAPRPINLQTEVADSLEAPLPGPDRLLAAIALETIGTRMAFAVLFEAALNHPDDRIRAHAISSLSTSYLHMSRNGKVIPEKAVLHLLIRNADDTTHSAHFGKSVGDIVREGLKEWAGIDLGPLALEKGRVTAESREQWWLENRENISWSDESKRFVIGKSLRP